MNNGGLMTGGGGTLHDVRNRRMIPCRSYAGLAIISSMCRVGFDRMNGVDSSQYFTWKERSSPEWCRSMRIRSSLLFNGRGEKNAKYQ